MHRPEAAGVGGQGLLDGLTGSDVVAGIGGLEEGVVQQQHRVGDGRQDAVDLPPDTGVAVVTIEEEEGGGGTPRPLPEAEGGGQPVALVQFHPRQAPHHRAPLGVGVLDVVDVVGKIAGMDGGGDMEILGDFMEDSRRFTDVGAPFEDQGGLEATHRRRHQHQFLKGKGMDSDHGNQGAGHERGRDPAVHLELPAGGIAGRVGRAEEGIQGWGLGSGRSTKYLQPRKNTHWVRTG